MPDQYSSDGKGSISALPQCADLRLRKYGYQVGLISEEEYQHLLKKESQIAHEIKRVEHTFVGASQPVQELLKRMNSTVLNSGSSLAELIRRPELTYQDLEKIDPERPKLPEDVQEQVNIISSMMAI